MVIEFSNLLTIQYGRVNDLKETEGTLINFPISYSTFYIVYACKRVSLDDYISMCDLNSTAFEYKDLSSFYFLNRSWNGEKARPVWLSIGY